MRQVALNNITKICNKVPWFNGKLKPGLKDLMNDLTKELKEENSLQEKTKKRKIFAFAPLKNLKGFKRFKGVKNRLSAMKSSLGSRISAAATRVRAATRRSKKSASSSSSKNYRPGNNRS